MVESRSTPSAPANPLLTCAGVSFFYTRHRPLLRDLSVELGPGIVSLIGPNGAGKSTLLNLMSGWLKPRSGSLSLLGKPLSHYRRRELARTIAVVPQVEEHVFPFTVFEVVEMGLFAEKGLMRWSAPEGRARVKACLEQLEIDQLACSPITECSGGERQLALIARALVADHQVMLLDEPTSSLDPRHQRQVLDAVRDWCRTGNRLAVVVTHDLTLAAAVSDRVLVLHEGRLFWDGTPAALLDSTVLETVYGTQFETAQLETGKRVISVRL